MTEANPSGAAAAPSPLAPPDGNALTLTAPPPPQPVAATQAPSIAPQIDPQAVPALDARVDGFLQALTTTQTRSPEFAAQANNVRTMGDADIRKAAETSNRLLQTPVRALKEGGIAEGSKVGNTLLELRRTVEDLDPSQATGARKLLGFPARSGRRSTDYFRKYQSAQSHLNGILHSLRNGQDELTQGQRRAEHGEAEPVGGDGPAQPVRLRRRAARREALRAPSPSWSCPTPTGPRRSARTCLFYVRQKHQDLLTQLAVSIQSYLAIDIIIKNNIELIKGVDRASTTTVSALRTAVIVAQALGNQKLVLDQITALNTTTSDLIQRTSEMMRDNSAPDPAAGGLGHHRPAPAAGRVPEHLRHHGLHRHLQAAGAGHHGGDHRHAGDRGVEVPRVPRPGLPLRPAPGFGRASTSTAARGGPPAVCAELARLAEQLDGVQGLGGQDHRPARARSRHRSKCAVGPHRGRHPRRARPGRGHGGRRGGAGSGAVPGEAGRAHRTARPCRGCGISGWAARRRTR